MCGIKISLTLKPQQQQEFVKNFTTITFKSQLSNFNFKYAFSQLTTKQTFVSNAPMRTERVVRKKMNYQHGNTLSHFLAINFTSTLSHSKNHTNYLCKISCTFIPRGMPKPPKKHTSMISENSCTSWRPRSFLNPTISVDLNQVNYLQLINHT